MKAFGWLVRPARFQRISRKHTDTQAEFWFRAPLVYQFSMSAILTAQPTSTTTAIRWAGSPICIYQTLSKCAVADAGIAAQWRDSVDAIGLSE